MAYPQKVTLELLQRDRDAGMTFAEIAQRYHITRQAVQQRLTYTPKNLVRGRRQVRRYHDKREN